MTKAQRAALEWFAERDAIAWFDRWAPTKVTRDRLEKAGLIESLPGKDFQAIQFQISEAGRAALRELKGGE